MRCGWAGRRQAVVEREMGVRRREVAGRGWGALLDRVEEEEVRRGRSMRRWDVSDRQKEGEEVEEGLLSDGVVLVLVRRMRLVERGQLVREVHWSLLQKEGAVVEEEVRQRVEMGLLALLPAGLLLLGWVVTEEVEVVELRHSDDQAEAEEGEQKVHCLLVCPVEAAVVVVQSHLVDREAAAEEAHWVHHLLVY